MTSLIITLIGPDRTGLVDTVSHLVAVHQGNWLESRMSHLAGYFAGIVRVEVGPAAADELVARLEALQEEGLSVVVRKDETDQPEQAVPLVRMELVGNDRPGIVREVTHVLAEHGVNVEEFETECLGAPISGSTLFRARASLRLPADLTLEALQQALESIALDLMVDIQCATSVERAS